MAIFSIGKLGYIIEIEEKKIYFENSVLVVYVTIVRLMPKFLSSEMDHQRSPILSFKL